MNPHPRVIGPNGEQTLGSFLRQCKDASGLPVTKIVEAAGISRANYYLLEKDTQRPSLATLVALLGAMGLEVRIPRTGGSDGAVDLMVTVDGDEYGIDLRWSAEERAKSRDRYMATTASGVAAAIGAAGALRPGAAPLGSGSLVAGGGVAASAIPLAGVIGTVMGQAAFMAARHLADRRARRESQQAEVLRAKSEILADVEKAADAMSTEDLEEILALMKAMRDVREGRD